MTKSFGYT